jgi:putative ABC transport system substrate-binding protein
MRINHLGRREFIALLGGAAVATSASCSAPWHLAARAQQSPNKIPVVGVLWHAASAEEEDVYLSVLLNAFHDLGYIDGKNVRLEHRFPAENPDRFRTCARELVESKVDAVIAVTTLGAVELKKLTSTIPIVFVIVADPIGFGLVESLARPGGNATGLSLMAIDLSGKRLGLLKEAVPNLSRVALLVDPTDPFKQRTFMANQAAAKALGISIWPAEIAAPDDVEPVFAKIVRDGADGVVFGAGSLLFNLRARIGAAALAHKLPALAYIAGPVRPADVIRAGLSRLFPPRSNLHRQDTERRKARRSAGRAAKQIQAAAQSQDRQGARAQIVRPFAVARRRRDRIVSVA